MGLNQEIQSGVTNILAPAWSIVDGRVVPTTEDIVLSKGAVRLNATYLYADLADSTALGQKVNKEVAAKVIRCYLDLASRTLNSYKGEIRSFDGDRVMAIFIGDRKCNDAVRAALAINWAVNTVMKPALEAKWPDLKQYWKIGHGIGIDTGEALLVRGGVRADNDLISVGAAPNVAAKLSSLRNGSVIYITDGVYSFLDEPQKMDGAKNMWTRQSNQNLGGVAYGVVASGYQWASA